MSLLKTPQELNQQVEPFIGLFAGEPGVGKSTFAYSAPNPFVIDGDNSSKRVLASHQIPALPVRTWTDVVKLVDSKDIEGRETCIVDAFGIIVNLCHDHIKTLPKMGDPRKSWPETAKEIGWMIRRVRSRGMHFVGLVHTKENEKDGARQIKPVSSGQALIDISYLADIFGLIYINGRKRILSVYPHGEYEFPAKGGAILGKDEIEIPEIKAGAPFDQFQRLILDPYCAFHKRKAEETSKPDPAYDKLCENATRILAVVSDTESMDVAYRELSALPVIGNSKQVWQEQIRELTTSRGWRYNATTKKFEVKQ